MSFLRIRINGLLQFLTGSVVVTKTTVDDAGVHGPFTLAMPVVRGPTPHSFSKLVRLERSLHKAPEFDSVWSLWESSVSGHLSAFPERPTNFVRDRTTIFVPPSFFFVIPFASAHCHRVSAVRSSEMRLFSPQSLPVPIAAHSIALIPHTRPFIHPCLATL